MLILRTPTPNDKPEILAAYQNSSALHAPWTSPPKDIDQYLAQEQRYFLCQGAAGPIVGTFHISGIIRGYFQSGYLGYEAFAPHHGQGHMRAGLALLLAEAFGPLNLHRLEANIQPGNLASIHIVASLSTDTMLENIYANLEASPYGDSMVAKGGRVRVPTGPGLGVEPDMQIVEKYRQGSAGVVK